MKRYGFTLASLLLASAGVWAQDVSQPRRGALQLQTVVEKVKEVETDGEVKTELVPVDVAVPGDEVVYTVRFTNVGQEPAENVLITNPIPVEMRYKAGTAFGPGTKIVYSADGGESYGEPADLEVADGIGQTRLASADEYTHIRWQLDAPLDPGAQGFARFRAVVR